MISQIPLTLNLHEENTLLNFYPEGNKQLLQNLHKAAIGRGERLFYLWGSSGAGKTHLLQACCHTANQKELRTFYLSLKKPDELQPAILQNLEILNLVCIDDIHCIVGQPNWEEAIFNCFNRIHESGKRLIIAGDKVPNQTGLQLLDLISRLNSALIFHLEPLSDEEKINALILRAQNRGFDLPKEVAQFILRRCNRNMSTLFSTLVELDNASLKEKHRLTIPFVKSVLQI